MTESIEQLTDIISKPGNQREEADIDGVIPWVRRRIQLLHNIDKRDLVEIITCCKHEKVAKNYVITQQGQPVDRMFIILRGSALVYIDTIPMAEEESVLPSTTTASLPSSDITVPSEMKRRNKLPERIGSGKHVMRYGAGKCFGEAALLSEDKCRNATVVSDEECDLMVIGQELFDKILRDDQQIEYNELCNFIECHPYFANLSPKFQRFLELSLRKETLPFDGTLVRQGHAVASLYFLQQGQANMYIEPTAYQKQYHKLWPFEAGIDLYSQEFEYLRKSRREAILRKYEDPAVSHFKSDHLIVRRTEGYAAAEKMVQERSVCLCTVHGGEVIGDLEIIQNLGTYLSTIICTAPTTVFVLDVRNLERLVGRRNQIVMEVMKKMAKEKLQRRASSCLGRDITFLNYLLFKITEQSFPLSEKKKLPSLKTSKFLPGKDVQIQHLLEKFKDGQAQLIEPRVPGALIYKEQMQEKARIRASFRRRGQHEISARLREVRQRIAVRQPRSRREIVKFLKQSMESKMVEYERGYKGDSSSTRSRKGKVQFEQTTADLENTDVVDGTSKNVLLQDQTTQFLTGEMSAHDSEKLKATVDVRICPETEHELLNHDADSTQFGNLGRSSLLSDMQANEETQASYILLPLRNMSTDTANSKVEGLESGVEVAPDNHVDQNADNSFSFASEYQRKEVSTISNSLSRLPPLAQSELKQTAEEVPSKWTSTMKLVNNRIADRFAGHRLSRDAGHLLSHDAGFEDYETSDKNLKLLENRIREFFANDDQPRNFTDKSSLTVPKLRRFKVDHEDSGLVQPKPGGRVWVRKTLCSCANTTIKNVENIAALGTIHRKGNK